MLFTTDKAAQGRVSAPSAGEMVCAESMSPVLFDSVCAVCLLLFVTVCAVCSACSVCYCSLLFALFVCLFAFLFVLIFHSCAFPQGFPS